MPAATTQRTLAGRYSLSKRLKNFPSAEKHYSEGGMSCMVTLFTPWSWQNILGKGNIFGPLEKRKRNSKIAWKCRIDNVCAACDAGSENDESRGTKKTHPSRILFTHQRRSNDKECIFMLCLKRANWRMQSKMGGMFPIPRRSGTIAISSSIASKILSQNG